MSKQYRVNVGKCSTAWNNCYEYSQTLEKVPCVVKRRVLDESSLPASMHYVLSLYNAKDDVYSKNCIFFKTKKDYTFWLLRFS